MSVGHSSTNEPLITASNQGSPSRQRESTAGSVAAEMAAGQPLPRTPPTEAYNTLSPVSGPYPTAITTVIPRGSPTRLTFGQNQTESPIHDAPPQGPRTSRRATSGYYTAQPEVDITERNEMQNGDEGYGFPEARMRTLSRRGTMGPVKTASIEDEKNAIDWIVPKSGGPLSRGVSMLGEKRRTVEERLQATLDAAKMELVKYQKKAQMAGLAINVALFAQIISNALITGLSAATSNRHAQIGVSALGALGTIISSFLVRVRGTREPDRSTAHSQNLEKFIRELEAFILDEGGSYDRKWDAEVKRFRTEFDRLQTAIHQSENGQPITDNSAAAPTVTPAHAVTPGPTTPGFGTPGPTTPGLGTPGFGGKIA